MPLKIRLKPERTFKIANSVVRNVGTKACELLIDGQDRVERDDYAGRAQLDQPKS